MFQRQEVFYIAVSRINLITQIMHCKVELVTHDPCFLAYIFYIDFSRHYICLQLLRLFRLHSLIHRFLLVLAVTFKSFFDDLIVAFQYSAVHLKRLNENICIRHGFFKFFSQVWLTLNYIPITSNQLLKRIWHLQPHVFRLCFDIIIIIVHLVYYRGLRSNLLL